MRKQSKRIISSIIMLTILMLIAIPVTAQASTNVYEYYGSKLSGDDKKTYTAIRDAWTKGEETTVPFLLEGDEIPDYITIGQLVLLDHPECFWVYGTGALVYNNEFSLWAIPRWKNAHKQLSTFENKVDKVVNQLKKKCKGKSTAQKAKIIHDWIGRNCSYKYSKYDQTAYGVFAKNKAVCAGYARAYKLLCDRLGVQCICVSGYVTQTDGPDGSHMINFVKIDKKWYYVDCTWDDKNGNKTPIHDYFLLGRNEAKGLTSCWGIKLPKLSKNGYKK